jgi:hypothetical protein
MLLAPVQLKHFTVVLMFLVGLIGFETRPRNFIELDMDRVERCCFVVLYHAFVRPLPRG